MRIGVIGWCVRTGIGAQNQDVWRLGFADKWLIPRHPVLGFDDAQVPPEATRTTVDHTPDEWLDGLDAVVFIEHPFMTRWPVVDECRRRGILTVCVPNLEWLPHPARFGWVCGVDVMWATSPWCAERLRELADHWKRSGLDVRWRDRIIAERWGVDCAMFKFQQRQRCERVLFANGTGGVLGRKGASVVAAAARQVPHIPIVVRSQTVKDLPRMPANVELIVRDEPERWRLFDDADLVLCPSRWEGLGLQLYEAQAAGCVVATTEARPMTDAGDVLRVRAPTVERVNLAGLPFDAHLADPSHLADIIRDTYGQDISEASLANRRHIESRHNLADTLAEVKKTLSAMLDRR